MTILTFEEFQRTRRFVRDLGKELSDSALDGPGFVYHGSYYIELTLKPARDKGAFYLLLNRDDWCSDDLEDLERKLYIWARDEGALEGISPERLLREVQDMVGERRDVDVIAHLFVESGYPIPRVCDHVVNKSSFDHQGEDVLDFRCTRCGISGRAPLDYSRISWEL